MEKIWEIIKDDKGRIVRQPYYDISCNCIKCTENIEYGEDGTKYISRTVGSKQEQQIIKYNSDGKEISNVLMLNNKIFTEDYHEYNSDGLLIKSGDWLHTKKRGEQSDEDEEGSIDWAEDDDTLYTKYFYDENKRLSKELEYNKYNELLDTTEYEYLSDNLYKLYTKSDEPGTYFLIEGNLDKDFVSTTYEDGKITDITEQQVRGNTTITTVKDSRGEVIQTDEQIGDEAGETIKYTTKDKDGVIIYQFEKIFPKNDTPYVEIKSGRKFEFSEEAVRLSQRMKDKILTYKPSFWDRFKVLDYKAVKNYAFNTETGIITLHDVEFTDINDTGLFSTISVSDSKMIFPIKIYPNVITKAVKKGNVLELTIHNDIELKLAINTEILKYMSLIFKTEQ